MAFTFLYAGITKATDPYGTAYKISDYLTAFGLGSFVPEIISILAGMCIAALEFYVGLLLLLGINRRRATRLCFGIMLLMTPLTLYIALVNPVSHCGCFGDALILTNWQTFYKNVILFFAVLVLLFFPKYRVPVLIRDHTQWMVEIYGIAFVFIMEFYGYYFLPVADFTDYKVGTNIPAEMEKWDDESQLDHLSALYDFSLQDSDTGEDVTDRFLNRKGFTFFLVVDDLRESEQGLADKINDFYAFCQQKGYAFYALTSSGKDLEKQWGYETGATYPFLNADGTVLKTLVRSNPGLVLLHDGIIAGKWGRNNLPGKSEVNGIVKEKTIQVESPSRKLMSVLFGFWLLPSAVILLLDGLWTQWKLLGKLRVKI